MVYCGPLDDVLRDRPRPFGPSPTGRQTFEAMVSEDRGRSRSTLPGKVPVTPVA